MLSALITVTCFSSISVGLPLPVHTTWRKVHSQNLGSLRTRRPRHKIPGIWRTTRYASILGPTVAIFLYSRLNSLYERYEPILTTELKEGLRYLATNRDFSSGRRALSLRTSRSGTNPYSLKVANEVIRIMNRRLREHAVISRIQMDDDQYEFNRLPSDTDMRKIAAEVMRDVMDSGSGKFLPTEEKYVVRKMVLRSIH